VITRPPLAALPLSAADVTFDQEVDAVVVGFGAAGACAALEARSRGAETLVVDRFVGGGASAISGGVVYAGGGTAIQQQAGVEDDVEAMFAYLRLETGDAISEATLRRFCAESAANLDWLAGHGVPFEASLCPQKTSYPSDRYYLYCSGNESFPGYREHARPAARGHRSHGKGLPGANFYGPLKAAALAAGAVLSAQTQARRLVVDGDRVVGVELWSLPRGFQAWRHRALALAAIRINPYRPQWAKAFRRQLAAIEARFARRRLVRARRGVILSTGGFVYNRAMIDEHAPAYRPGMPLGTTGCDGSGILLGQSAGGAVDRMDRVSAWRFINPPDAFTKGIVVDRQGERYCNERLYGAQLGRKMVEEHRGEALLIIDQALWTEARGQVKRGEVHWFQQAPALINLYSNRRVGGTVAELERAARIPEGALAATVEAYNAGCAAGEDAFGKDADHLHPLSQGPFYAIDCSLGSRRFPCPTLTLGGLVVDEVSGGVRSTDGTPIPGLYAAGRAAVGVSSEGYVSGLSLADCVFSGRRAGASVAP
jgi:3-oxo-5alpha-steroid 4-dehydrogenase